MQQTFLFGYGSLMFPAGTNNRGMMRFYIYSDYTICRLHDFHRGGYLLWDNLGYYSIIPAPRKYVLGTVIEIRNEADLNAILRVEYAKGFVRESQPWAYEVLDVTSCIGDFKVPSGARVLTVAHPPDREIYDGPLSQWYQNHVFKHIQYYGPEFVKEFLSTGGRAVEG